MATFGCLHFDEVPSDAELRDIYRILLAEQDRERNDTYYLSVSASATDEVMLDDQAIYAEVSPKVPHHPSEEVMELLAHEDVEVAIAEENGKEDDFIKQLDESPYALPSQAVVLKSYSRNPMLERAVEIFQQMEEFEVSLNKFEKLHKSMAYQVSIGFEDLQSTSSITMCLIWFVFDLGGDISPRCSLDRCTHLEDTVIFIGGGVDTVISKFELMGLVKLVDEW